MYRNGEFETIKEEFLDRFGKRADLVKVMDPPELTPGEGYINLDLVQVFPDCRHQGHAQAVLALLVELLDEYQVNAHLLTRPVEDECARELVTEEGLKRLYGRFGFVAREGTMMMVRVPRVPRVPCAPT